MPKCRVLLFESTKPQNPSIGGSFRSLKVVADCLDELDANVWVGFYFSNFIEKELREAGFKTIILPYYTPFRLITKFARNVLKFIRGLRQRRYKSRPVSLLEDTPPATSRKNSQIRSAYEYFLCCLNSISIIMFIWRHNIEVIYCNTGVNIDRAAILAGLLMRRQVVCHLRNRPTLTKLDHILLVRTNLLIAISNSVKDYYIGQTGDRIGEIKVIHNSIGRDIELFPKSIGPSVLAKNGSFSIGFFARLIDWKGAKEALIEFRIFLDKGGLGSLHFFGDGPEIDSLRRLAKNFDITSQVFFHGFVNNVPSAIKKCSVVVCPSTRPEPLGRVVMEAMHLGIPVIASNSGGHLETIDDNLNGLLVDIDKRGELADQLLNLYRHPQERTRIAGYALDKSSNWSLETYKLKFRKLMDEIL